MITLMLGQRLGRATGLVRDLTGIARGWRRATRAVGGYWTGEFTVDLPWDEIAEAWQTWLGCRIVEYTAGIVTWEGLIYEMRLVQGGREYLLSLAPDLFHNRVQVVYTDAVGAQATIAWSENADSSAEFGRRDLLLSLGGATSAAATALRDRHLEQFGWPRARATGGIQFGEAARPASPGGLQVSCVGYWATLGWRYYETTTTAAASSLIGTLVGASEWITTGQIDANTLSVQIDCANPRLLGDLLDEVIAAGDVSGNVWQGGVYAGRKFDYSQAPTVPTHYISGGQLRDLGGMRPLYPTVRPGILVRNRDEPVGLQPAGASSVWDDPQVAYVEEVEYAYPDGLRLKFGGADEGVLLLERQIQEGVV